MGKPTISTKMFISICIMIVGLCFIFFVIGMKYSYVKAIDYANEQYLENCWSTQFGVNKYEEKLKHIYNFSNINIT